MTTRTLSGGEKQWRVEDWITGAVDRIGALERRLRSARYPLMDAVQETAYLAFGDSLAHVPAAWSSAETQARLVSALPMASPHARHLGFARLLATVRNILVLAPIALTWYGLGIAADVYSTCRVDQQQLRQQESDRLAGKPVLDDVRNALIRVPFLKLWELRFDLRADETDPDRAHFVCDTGRIAEKDWLGLGLGTFGHVVDADLKILTAIAAATISLTLVRGSLDRRRQGWMRFVTAEIDWLTQRAGLRIEERPTRRGKTAARAGPSVELPLLADHRT